MRQRLGLATALLGDPQVLILDEPANGLDPEGVHWLRGLLRQLADQGRTVLVSSHVLAEVAQTVDQVVIIASGRLVTQSTLAALTARTDQLVRVRTPQTDALRSLLTAEGIQAHSDGADQLLAVGTTPETVGKAAAAAGIVIYEMGAERSNLEDVFLQLTTAKEPDHDPSGPRRVHQAPTTRVVYGMAAVMAAFAVLTVVALMTTPDIEGNPALSAESLPMFVAAPVTLLSGAALLLGILGMTGEFRHQTITQTFLVTPDRGRVVAANWSPTPWPGSPSRSPPWPSPRPWRRDGWPPRGSRHRC